MFSFFNRKAKCPVEEERRQWIDKAFIWLVHEFGADFIKNVKVLTPNETDFPFKFVGDEENAYEVLDVIAPPLNINVDDIEIEFYTEAESEIETGGAYYTNYFLKQADGEEYSSGHYRGKLADGKYHIGFETKFLNNPEQMIATLAHELLHIKLLGEERIKKNDETLTDLATIIFGLGIFGANSAFQLKSTRKDWGCIQSGYLSQMDWGYALALFAFIRKEKTPEWINFLTLNVKSDFEHSEKFISENEAIILKPAAKDNETSEF